MTSPVAIALGSNLGDKLSHLQYARDVIKKHLQKNTSILAAPIYESAPVDCPAGSPVFFNTAITFPFQGTPHELLEITQRIELESGRDAVHALNAPRVIDIDILYFGSLSLREPELTIPHYALTQRRFVLQPLADIAPDVILPGDPFTIAQHLQKLQSNEPPLTLVHTNW